MNLAKIILSTYLLAHCLAFAGIKINPIHNNNGLIYGADNRHEVEDFYDREFADKAQSIALRVPSKRLMTDPNDENSIIFRAQTLRELMPQLCPSENI